MKLPQYFLRICAAFLLPLILTACASSSGGAGSFGSSRNTVDHGFTFDVQSDSPGHYLLDYRYGSSNSPVTAPSEWMRNSGSMRQQGGTFGHIPLGNDLYVKWRVAATGQTHEKTVDLRNKLPRDMTGYRLKFVLKDDVVYIYAISPEKAPPNWPRYDPSPRWTEYKVFSVYPTNNVNQLK